MVCFELKCIYNTQLLSLKLPLVAFLLQINTKKEQNTIPTSVFCKLIQWQFGICHYKTVWERLWLITLIKIVNFGSMRGQNNLKLCNITFSSVSTEQHSQIVYLSSLDVSSVD